MKGLAKRSTQISGITVLMLLLVIQSVAIPCHAESEQSQTLVTVNSPVSYPLPTAPEPVLIGDPLRIEVDAGPDAGGWAAKLTSGYASHFLAMINSSYTEDEGWTLFYEVPTTLHPELYSLNIAFHDGGDAVNHTQPRSVWVLEEWPDRLTIGHITDPHLPYEADVLATYVYEANLIQPDVVICTGDIVDVETIAKAWTHLQEIIDRLERPSFLLPGNHDYAGARSAYYQRYCGLLNYSVHIGNFLFMALDTTDSGYVTMDLLRWAEHVLQRYPNKVKIIGFHHPLFSSGEGGHITGSWEEIENLREYMYFTWEEYLPEARELLRLIEDYDVRLILAGHVHRDVIYVYNDRHYFVTTSTCGGSLPQGFYYCSRLVEVDVDGNIGFDAYAERQLFDPPNSIPTGLVTYYYKTDNDGTETAVSATVINGQERQLTDAKLEFLVSAEYLIEDYAFYTTAPDRVETFTTKMGHRFIAHVDVPPLGVLHLTLATAGDDAGPVIEVASPGEIEEETPISLTMAVDDEGWGVKELEASYSTDGGATWSDVDLQFHLQVSADEHVVEYPTSEYEVTLPGQAEGTELMVEVNAWDFADNSETYQATYTIGPLPAPTHALSVESSPATGITFTLDGQKQTTPYATNLEEDVYTVSAPSNVTVAGTDYNFVRWEDGTADPTRTVDLSEDTTLIVHYEEAPLPTYALSVESSPVAGIAFTVDGRSQTTPYSTTFEEGEHTLTVPTETTIAGDTYSFVRWEDGTTDSTRTTDLRSDATLTVYYEAAQPPPSPKPGIPMWMILVAAAVIIVLVAAVFLKMKG